jgi:hypothetical protein
LNDYPFLDVKQEFGHDAKARDMMTPVEDINLIPANGLTVGQLGKYRPKPIIERFNKFNR